MDETIDLFFFVLTDILKDMAILNDIDICSINDDKWLVGHLCAEYTTLYILNTMIK